MDFANGEEFMVDCKLSSKNYLSSKFTPADNDVVIGRGKKWLSHKGNEKLRDLVQSKLEEYSAATSKNEKSKILSYIVTEIRTADPGKKGSFVKFESKAERWFDVGDFLARERVSQAFRDALHKSYRSSNEYKKKRKREQNFKASLSRKFLRADTHDIKCADPKSLRIRTRYNDFSNMFDLEAKSSLETVNIASGLAYSLPASCSLVQWFEDIDDAGECSASDEETKMTPAENFDFIHTLNDYICGMGSPQPISTLTKSKSDISSTVKKEYQSTESSKILGFEALPSRNVASARTA